MPWESPPQTFLTGNTAGTTHVFGPNVTLSGGPNITLSGQGNKIVISANAPGAATGGDGGVFLSAGTQSQSSGQVVFANSNGVSFGMSGSSQVTATVKTDYLSGAIGLNSAQSNVTWTVNSSGISFDGRGYAGTGTSATNASLTLNGNGLAISVGAGGAAAVPTINQFGNMRYGPESKAVPFGSVAGSLFVGELCPERLFPGQMTVSTVFLFGSAISNVSMSAARSYSLSIGFYTLNSDSLSLASSASTLLSNNADANASALWHGARQITFDQSLFPGSSLAFSNTSYWVGILQSSAGSTMNIVITGGDLQNLGVGAGGFGTMGVSQTQSALNELMEPWYGTYTATTNALPNAIVRSDLQVVLTRGWFPWVFLHNSYSSF